MKFLLCFKSLRPSCGLTPENLWRQTASGLLSAQRVLILGGNRPKTCFHFTFPFLYKLKKTVYVLLSPWEYFWGAKWVTGYDCSLVLQFGHHVFGPILR